MVCTKNPAHYIGSSGERVLTHPAITLLVAVTRHYICNKKQGSHSKKNENNKKVFSMEEMERPISF
jgi:hypothetical protein